MKPIGSNGTTPSNRAGTPVRPSIAQRLAALLLVFAVLLGLNVHLFLLQLAGWAGMVADYREESGSWIAAVRQTAVGDDPCDLCRQVENALTHIRGRTDGLTSGNEFRLLPFLLIPLGRTVSPSPTPPAVSGTLLSLSETAEPNVFRPDPPPPRRSV